MKKTPIIYAIKQAKSKVSSGYARSWIIGMNGEIWLLVGGDVERMTHDGVVVKT